MKIHSIENPWFVENLTEFLYFCCPECDEKNHSEESFLEHALNEHPNAKECLQKFQIKEEILDEDFFEDNENLSIENSGISYDNELFKCEIKEESNEIVENKPLLIKTSIKKTKTNTKKINSTKDSQSKRFDCNYCSKKFNKLKVFMAHIKNVHKCVFCDEHFRQENDLLEHMKVKCANRNTNEGLIKYNCKLCHRSFSELKRDILTLL